VMRVGQQDDIPDAEVGNDLGADAVAAQSMSSSKSPRATRDRLSGPEGPSSTITPAPASPISSMARCRSRFRGPGLPSRSEKTEVAWTRVSVGLSGRTRPFWRTRFSVPSILSRSVSTAFESIRRAREARPHKVSQT
jgi:hypothetical protein